jgi:hypothetical protein
LTNINLHPAAVIRVRRISSPAATIAAGPQIYLNFHVKYWHLAGFFVISGGKVDSESIGCAFEQLHGH